MAPFFPLRGFTRNPPPMEMLNPSTGITVWRYKPRGSTSPAHYEVRAYIHDPLFDTWNSVTIPGTFPTVETATEAAKSYLTHIEEQVWPKTVDTSRKKR